VIKRVLTAILIWFTVFPALYHNKRLTGVSHTNYAQTGQHYRKCQTKHRTLTQVKPSATFVVGADWESYTEQLDFYFLANGVMEPKTKRAVLLTNLPAECYQLVKDLVAPTQLKDDAITYDIIVGRM